MPSAFHRHRVHIRMTREHQTRIAAKPHYLKDDGYIDSYSELTSRLMSPERIHAPTFVDELTEFYATYAPDEGAPNSHAIQTVYNLGGT